MNFTQQCQQVHQPKNPQFLENIFDNFLSCCYFALSSITIYLILITDSYASLFSPVWILPHTGLRQEKLHNFWTLLQRFPNSRFPFWPGLKNSASLLFLFSVCITINTLRVFLLLSKHVQFFHRGMYCLFIFGTNLDSGFGIRT